MATAAGPRPAGLDAHALPDVAAAFGQPGPFVTVYLDVEPDVEDAAHRSDVHWKDVRKVLEEAGAPARALDAIAAVVPDAHFRGAAMGAVANGRGLLLERSFEDPLKQDLARAASLPSVPPMIEEAQSEPTHVVVLVDRVGGDIVLVDAKGDGRVISVDPERPDDPVIRRSKPGGWSQRVYQQRAMNRWKSDAEQVAEATARIATDARARVVILAGEPQAVHFFRESLPRGFTVELREIPGSRAAGADTDAMAEEVVRVVATAVAEDTVRVLEKFREERGQHDRAADGAEPTLAALAAAQVDLLLVHDDPADQRTAWFGPEPNMVGIDAETVQAMGVEEPTEGRLIDVAVRAAFGTGAATWIVPDHGGPAERIGAILRFASPTGSG
ncbi:MAG: hypothetical protein JWO37_1035 [Acidimicrobiales bacterium]|jgi:hypothetical protein|nr:hypothetical protein [Acidimicrobiales bacterium]